MSQSFTFEAKSRQDIGKGASRRLRRLQSSIPAVLFGGDKNPESITLDHDSLLHALENEAVYTSVLTLNVDGKPQQAILKDLQRHPYKPTLLHADFLRVTATSEVTLHIPLHFVGTAPGEKKGGVVTHLLNELEVKAKTADLPEYLEIDISNLNIGDSIHVADMVFPKGVVSNVSPEMTVVNVQESRASKVEDESSEAASSEDKA